MIPAGRTAIDQRGIAELHGLSIHQAKRQRPWAKPGHPAPITTGRPSRGHPQLWDRDQAAAYARDPKGPIPELPPPGHPDDLLDNDEAAALAEMKPATWDRYRSHDRARDADHARVPTPDTQVYGTDYWHRHTVEEYRTLREQRADAPRGGRPPGATDGTSRADLPARVTELLADAEQRGEPIVIADIARTLGVHYTTAHRYVTEARKARSE